MTLTPAEREAGRLYREAKLRERKAVKRSRLAKVMPEASEQRKPRQRDNGYLAFLRRQPCVINIDGVCSGPIEACHIRYSTQRDPNPGMQNKSRDSRAVSMCSYHHRSQHATGEYQWWARRGLDPDTIADRLYAQYKAGEETP